ncbi:lipase family alpha/beta hydrolase [Rugamonas rubra]|uniref:PGAP1-like protein n=1 Tax=Rugamonas rubra TaxID=758825 RepID=A0A1I4JVG5_9BURK|nr:alpha/beta hydrolase [Rugamonas rubra]SFL70331.1 PGAP1-like protein [Rugamonas rubra]
MSEPTRRLPNPTVDSDGTLRTKSMTTPKSCKIIGAVADSIQFVIPVIVVPGVMGSNLRATTNPSRPQNKEVKAGAPVWRPPNNLPELQNQAATWVNYKPGQRQQMLDAATLEVDDSGHVPVYEDAQRFGINESHMRDRKWGEIHSMSYGLLLYTLERHLNSTFIDDHSGKQTFREHWSAINRFDRKRWNAPDMAPLTKQELEKLAHYQYPVYAFGYNWLESNEQSADHLKTRIEEILRYWTACKHTCKQVILVTHSMGGLVARACARKIPDSIVGIVHGVMPTLGAPLSYRRIACGTEKGGLRYFSEIAGNSTEATTPVMAVSPGALELLPNHLYPKPWLFVSIKRGGQAVENILSLPMGNTYDLYRDMTSWYRLIDPTIADPAGKYDDKDGGLTLAITQAIGQAEKFHTTVLGTYYHPNSYAFYGNDAGYPSYAACRWTANVTTGEVGADALRKAKTIGHTLTGGRSVMVDGRGSMYFELATPDAQGDGTVPSKSGAEPRGKVLGAFATERFSHQGCYNDEAMLNLTQHLIVKIVQAAK